MLTKKSAPKRERGTVLMFDQADPALWAAAKARAASEGRNMKWVVFHLIAWYVKHGLPTAVDSGKDNRDVDHS